MSIAPLQDSFAAYREIRRRERLAALQPSEVVDRETLYVLGVPPTLTTRFLNVLRYHTDREDLVITFGELAATDYRELYRARGMGRKTLTAVVSAFLAHGAPAWLSDGRLVRTWNDRCNPRAWHHLGRDERLRLAGEELLAVAKDAQRWIDAALQAFEGHPDPSENEGKHIDARMLGLIRRIEEGA